MCDTRDYLERNIDAKQSSILWLNNFHTFLRLFSSLNFLMFINSKVLVNLTAFKKRMTELIETFGGSIDVVVISKRG